MKAFLILFALLLAFALASSCFSGSGDGDSGGDDDDNDNSDDDWKQKLRDCYNGCHSKCHDCTNEEYIPCTDPEDDGLTDEEKEFCDDCDECAQMVFECAFQCQCDFDPTLTQSEQGWCVP